MGRKRKPPEERKPATMVCRDAECRVQCWHCGQRLPNTVRGLDGSVKLSGWDGEVWGWRLDGTALRPTQGQMERRKRAREIVRLGGGREVKTQRILRGDAPLLPISHALADLHDDRSSAFPHVVGKTIDRIECPCCRAENLLEPHSAVR